MAGSEGGQGCQAVQMTTKVLSGHPCSAADSIPSPLWFEFSPPFASLPQNWEADRPKCVWSGISGQPSNSWQRPKTVTEGGELRRWLFECLEGPEVKPGALSVWRMCFSSQISDASFVRSLRGQKCLPW